jgi:hypothetical protein
MVFMAYAGVTETFAIRKTQTCWEYAAHSKGERHRIQVSTYFFNIPGPRIEAEFMGSKPAWEPVRGDRENICCELADRVGNQEEH